MKHILKLVGYIQGVSKGVTHKNTFFKNGMTELTENMTSGQLFNRKVFCPNM